MQMQASTARLKNIDYISYKLVKTYNSFTLKWGKVLLIYWDMVYSKVSIRGSFTTDWFISWGFLRNQLTPLSCYLSTTYQEAWLNPAYPSEFSRCFLVIIIIFRFTIE